MPLIFLSIQMRKNDILSFGSAYLHITHSLNAAPLNELDSLS